MEETLIEKFKVTGEKLNHLIKTFFVMDDSTLTRANNALLYIKRVRKEISDFCDPNIDRLNKAHKEALAQKKTFEKPFILAEQYIKPQIASYLDRLAIERLEAERKQRDLKKAEEKFGLPPSLPVSVPPPPKQKLKGVYVKKTWKFKITNKSLIPAEYWMLDLVKIGQVARESKGQAKILGVEFYQDSVVGTRG